MEMFQYCHKCPYFDYYYIYIYMRVTTEEIHNSFETQNVKSVMQIYLKNKIYVIEGSEPELFLNIQVNFLK